MSSKLRLMLLPMLFVAVAGCNTKQMMNNQGYIADKELVDAIQPGVDNRQSVERTLGRPTQTAQWTDDTWYYISRNTKQLAFARPTPRDQSVLIVRFDKAGNVASVEQRGMEQVANIAPHKDKTPTLGKEASLLDDLFGNIGSMGAMPGAGGPQ